jgi:hypothetical protein
LHQVGVLPSKFQDRRFQPLTHSSVFNSNVFCELAANLLQFGLDLFLPVEAIEVRVRSPGDTHRAAVPRIDDSVWFDSIPQCLVNLQPVVIG